MRMASRGVDAETARVLRDAVRRIASRVLLPLGLGYVLLLCDRAAIGFVAPLLEPALALDAFQVGLTTPVLFLGVLLFEVPSAMVAYRVRAGRWLAVLVLLWGAAGVATAAATGPGTFFAARIVASIAEAGYLPVALFLAAGAVPGGVRTRVVTGIVLLALGTAIVQPSVVAMLLRFDGALGLAGWRWMFLCFALPCLPLAFALGRIPAAVPSAAWLTERERDVLAWMRSVEGRRGTARTGLDALLDSRILLLAGLNFGLSLSTFAAGNWYAALMRDPRAPVLPMSVALVAATLVTVVLWSRRVDRSGRVADGLLMACTLATVGYAAGVVPGPVATKLVGLVAHGATLAAARSFMWSVGSRVALGCGGAASLAIIDATGLVGSFVAPRVVLGVVQQAGNLQLGLMFLTASLAAATALAGLLKVLTRGD